MCAEIPCPGDATIMQALSTLPVVVKKSLPGTHLDIQFCIDVFIKKWRSKDLGHHGSLGAALGSAGQILVQWLRNPMASLVNLDVVFEGRLRGSVFEILDRSILVPSAGNQPRGKKVIATSTRSKAARSAAVGSSIYIYIYIHHIPSIS